MFCELSVFISGHSFLLIDLSFPQLLCLVCFIVEHAVALFGFVRTFRRTVEEVGMRKVWCVHTWWWFREAFWAQTALVWILGLRLRAFVTLGEPFNVRASVSSSAKWEEQQYLPPVIFAEIECDVVVKLLSGSWAKLTVSKLAAGSRVRDSVLFAVGVPNSSLEISSAFDRIKKF